MEDVKIKKPEKDSNKRNEIRKRKAREGRDKRKLD